MTLQVTKSNLFIYHNLFMLILISMLYYTVLKFEKSAFSEFFFCGQVAVCVCVCVCVFKISHRVPPEPGPALVHLIGHRQSVKFKVCKHVTDHSSTLPFNYIFYIA